MRLTIQCGVVKLTNFKQKVLDREYNNIQTLIKLQSNNLDFLPMFKNIKLYSANKQQALRYFKKYKSKKYPISLRKDLINLQKAKSFWFLKVPICNIRGGIKIPIKPHKEFPKRFTFCESKLIRKNGKYIVMLTVEFDTPILRKCSSVLAVDLGERVTATAVLLQDNNVKKVKFMGRNIRGIRRHYAWLRKRLQKKGLTKLVKRIGSKERCCVNDVLHNISKEIVGNFDGGKIVMENLKGIRKIWRGKRMNYWISNWSFFQLQSFIQYKALRKGIEFIKVKPKYTSQLCSNCGNLGSRSGSSFVCSHCGFSLNADLNASRNLASPMLEKRQALVTEPHNRSNEAEGFVKPIEVELTVKSPTL